MRIVVTGAAGFIGSHLADRLIGLGHTVIGLDNLFTGRMENINHLLKNPAFFFVNHDIVNPFMDESVVDQIYNLACPASPVHYQHNPVHTIKASTIGVINMLGFARRHGARFLQTSTSEVYGDPEAHPQPETYRGNVNPVGPRACYDEGKRCSETLCFDYHRMHGMEIKVVRIFNTYGPAMAFEDGRVVSNFILQALKGDPLTIYGDGSQTRSFCYVDEMVDGLIKMMNSPAEITGPVNLGNPGEFSMRELAELVLRLTGSKSRVEYLELPVDDPRRRCPDITLARTTLDWNPTIPLSVGLDRTIENFRQRLNV